MGNEIVNYDKAWAEQAAQYAAQEQLAGGTFLSTRGGTLSFGEELLPGNQACVIILDAVKENTYYQGKFDPDNAMPPVCYAFGRGPKEEDEMAPHASMQTDLSYFVPQATECKVCPHHEWGSANQGRGKACQERRRLALIPAGFYTPKRGSRDFDLQLFDDVKHFQTADIAFLKLSVGSVKEWGKFVNQVVTTFHRPPHGVIARIGLVPDAKWQFLTTFEVIEELPGDLTQIIMQRHDEATKGVIQGYLPPQDKTAAAPATRGSLRGLRREAR
jgi:hypothetical protein